MTKKQELVRALQDEINGRLTGASLKSMHEVIDDKHTAKALQPLLTLAQALPEAEVSLRDQFAMAALTGLTSLNVSGPGPEYFAEGAYRLADAMLEARKQRPGLVPRDPQAYPPRTTDEDAY